uniref:Pentatricopeptide repeat-containing protein n=1 Tax=Arundo donax TaxID=35708 RepID=A0A0A8YF51_ARUDO
MCYGKWNALLNGYARDGDYRKVMLVFDKLVESGDEICRIFQLF